jgi:hypothetical protein
MSNYAWVITTDHLDNMPACVTGPRDATDEQIALAHEKGTRFKIYDDDGELYYSGRFWSDGTNGDDDFGPLDDYGAPNAGATEIRYRDASGKYVTL